MKYKGEYRLNKRNRELYVVREQQKDKPKQSLTQRARGSKNKMTKGIKRIWKESRNRVIWCGVAVIVIIAGILLVNLQTYTKVRTAEVYQISGAADNSYKEFADGVLKYSRDGVAYLDYEGQEQWNLPYQIKTPLVATNRVTAAVADKGGNDILVFQEQGVKGEIHTTLPIERIALSEQGIVCAILKNEKSPQIMCYDTAGNILIEHKASFGGSGYPMDVALSPNGEMLQVLYLLVEQGQVKSKAVYYDFGAGGEEKEDHQTAEKEYANTVLASGFFINKSVSVAVGDNCLTIFKGEKNPKEVTTIQIDQEIKSVFHNEKYIGVVLKNTGKAGSKLRLYNTAGKVVLEETFSGDYKNVKISRNQVIMYDGKQCSIFTKNGIHKFDGEFNENIMEIVPISGVNKYLVITANGMEEVRLVK